MINLLLSIFLSTYLIIAFKYFVRFRIDNFQAIVFNYLACVVTGMIFSGSLVLNESLNQKPWLWEAILLGCSFICFFNVMGYISVNIGMTVTSVANKLSMVIPVGVSFILYHDKPTFIRITAICLAVLAVVFTSYKSEPTDGGKKKHTTVFQWILIFSLFAGSGCNDALIKWTEVQGMQQTDYGGFNTVIFATSFSIGFMAMIIGIILKKISFHPKNILAGIILGVPNYFSMHYLLKTVDTPGWDSSRIFPLNNIGIVVCTAVFAFILFREKFSGINLAGLALAIAAIGLLLWA